MNKNPSNRPRLAKSVVKPIRIFLGLILTLLLSFLLFSSYITKYAVQHWFKAQGATIEIEDLTLSILDSKIEVLGFSSHKDQRFLTLKSLNLDWQWFSLWGNELTIDDLQISGLTLDLVNENSQLQQIGPLVIAQSQNNIEQISQQTKQLDNADKNWKINYQDVSLGVDKICIHGHDLLPQPFSEKIFFQPAAPLNVDLNKQPLCFSSQINWSGAGKLDLSSTLQATIAGNLEINNNQLTLANELLFKNDSIKAQQLKFDANQINLAKLSLSNTQLGSLTSSLTSSQEPNLHLLTLYSAHLEDFILDELQFNLSLQSLNAMSLKLKSFTFDRLLANQYSKLASLKKLTISALEQSPNLTSVESISLAGAHVLENKSSLPDQEQSFLAGLSEITGHQVKLNPESISFRELNIEGVFANFIIDKTGQPDINRWLELTTTDAPNNDKTANPPLTEQESVSFSFLAQAITLNNSHDILFADLRTPRQSDQTVSDLTITLNSLNNLGEEFNTKLTALVNRSGKLALSGPGQFQNDQFNTSINGSLTNLDLGVFSKYSERFIGYRIDQGTLSSKLDFKIKNSVLNSMIDLNLNKFELGDLEQHEQHPLNEELGVPLPLALSLLRDSDNNINIELPISGDVTSPDFSINDIIATVSIKAIKSAIIYQYSPFGLLTLASGAIDLATGLSFDPITFSQSNHTLTSQHSEQLESTVKLMLEKPQLSLVLCGQSSVKDLKNLVQETQSDPNEKASQQVAEEQREQLLELARKRQSAVAAFLQQNAIPQDRIILCNVKLGDITNQSPQVNIKI